ncbi:MAG: segregation/condensation protein A [Ruminococcus sp.]|nr:segregation/condensation protein A [Ruminococcus sp.]
MSCAQFKLDMFEGPLDLLLHLISKHKLNIHDIEISLLLEQYLEYMHQLDHEDLEDAAEFLEMAARLIYIKTVSLLPQDEEAQELKKELEGRLIEYSQCKLLAAKLAEKYAGGEIFVRKPEPVPVDKTYTREHDAQILLEAYLGLSEKARNEKPINAKIFSPIVSYKVVSVGSKIVYILKKLYTVGVCDLSHIYDGMTSKSEKVATFLAILELTKSGRIRLNDDNTQIEFSERSKRRIAGGGRDEEEKPEETIPEVEAEQVAEEAQPEETIPEVEAEQVAEEAQPEELVSEEETEQAAEEAQSEEVIPEVEAEQVAEEAQPEETIPEVEAEQVTEEAQPEETIPEVEVEQVTEAAQPEETIPEVEAEQVAEEAQPEETIPEDKPAEAVGEAEIIPEFTADDVIYTPPVSEEADKHKVSVRPVTERIAERAAIYSAVKARPEPTYPELPLQPETAQQSDESDEQAETPFKPNYWNRLRYRWGSVPVADDAPHNCWRYGRAVI